MTDTDWKAVAPLCTAYIKAHLAHQDYLGGDGKTFDALTQWRLLIELHEAWRAFSNAVLARCGVTLTQPNFFS